MFTKDYLAVMALCTFSSPSGAFQRPPPKNYFCKDLSVFCSPSTFSHNNNKKVFSLFSHFSPFSHSYKLLLFFLSSNTPIFLSKSVSSFFFPSFYHLSSFVFFSFLEISRFSNIFFSIFASFF